MKINMKSMDSNSHFVSTIKIQSCYRAFLLVLLAMLMIACQGQPDAIDSQDRRIDFKNYADKWIVLNYWADWCKPCYEELPAFNAFFKQHADKAVVFGVSFDNLAKDQIQQFAKQFHIDYPLLVNNPGSRFGIEEIAHLPATFLIAPDRKKVVTLFGPQTEQSLLAAMEAST